MRFRVLNKDPLYDYREECKLTQGIDMFESDEPPLKTKDTLFRFRYDSE